MVKLSGIKKSKRTIGFDVAYINIIDIIDHREINMKKLKSVKIFDDIEDNLGILKKYEKCQKIQYLIGYSMEKKKYFYADYIRKFYERNCNDPHSV